MKEAVYVARGSLGLILSEQVNKSGFKIGGVHNNPTLNMVYAGTRAKAISTMI